MNITIELFKDKYNKYYCYHNSCPTFPKANSFINTTALFEPIIKKNWNYLFAVQVGPSEIVSRMIFRKLFKKYKRTIKDLGYIFFMGLPYYNKKNGNTLKDINLKDLVKEYYTFKDMIIFNFVNSYYRITLQLFSLYKWIVKKQLKIKKMIRMDSNAIVYEKKLKYLLKNRCDLQGYPCKTRELYYNISIIYPQGSFHIISNKLLKKLVEYYDKSIIVKSNDKSTGLIIHKLLTERMHIRICWFNNCEVDLLLNFHDYVINITKQSIAFHPIIYSAIDYYFNYKL